jgi:hypothetical protein
MELPSGVKPGLSGAAAGAIALAVVGFSYLGWTTASTAQKLAQDAASAAVVTALVPFCVIKAETDPNPAIMTKFRAEQWGYTRSRIVMKAGWATFGDKTPDSDALAIACADQLHAGKAS